MVALGLMWYIFSTGWNNGQADTIIYGGIIYNLKGQSPKMVEAVAMKGDRILFIGSQKLAFKFRGKETKMVNLKGKRMPNGYFDSYKK